MDQQPKPVDKPQKVQRGGEVEPDGPKPKGLPGPPEKPASGTKHGKK